MSQLTAVLEVWARRPFAELTQYLSDPQVIEVTGPSGAVYQVEIEVFWDNETGGTLRIMAGIDDGGWSSLCPICDSRLVEPPNDRA